jgi:methylphosphotriester-DNA--protein-cysteine methyltransferase
MKKLLLSTVTLILLGASVYATDIIKEGQEYPIEKMKEQNQKIIKMVVEEISKTLPQKVDKYTKMTKIRDENLTLIYTFEINTGVKSDEAVQKEDKPRMEKAVTKGVCQSSKRFIDAGVSLSYEYLSATSKKELFSFHMNEEICKELKDD